MARIIDSAVYDHNVRVEGVQSQIDNFYQPVSVAQQRRIDFVLRDLSPQPRERILDVGCGVGTFVYHSSLRGAWSVGIDYSSVSVQVGRDLSRRFGTQERSAFAVATCLSLPFQDASFDKVVAADFIEHITDEEKIDLLAELRRVLKPGGSGVICTPNRIRERLGERYWHLRHVIRGDRVPKTDLHYGLIDRSAFESLLRKAGFSFRLRFADTTRPWLARLPLLKHSLALNLVWTIGKL